MKYVIKGKLHSVSLKKFLLETLDKANEDGYGEMGDVTKYPYFDGLPLQDGVESLMLELLDLTVMSTLPRKKNDVGVYLQRVYREGWFGGNELTFQFYPSVFADKEELRLAIERAEVD